MHRMLVLACLAGLSGCDDGGEPPDVEGAIIDIDPQAQRVSTLLASIGVEVDGERLAADHIAEVHLAVNGIHWGVFGFDVEPGADWAFATGEQALMEARINADLTLGETGPETIGGWTTYLSRSLPAGDHVVQVTRIILRNGIGKETEVHSQAWVPFRVELGDASAWIGDLLFTLEALP